MIKTLLCVLLCLCIAAPLTLAETDQKPFGGVGLQVVPTVNGDLTILRVVAGSPAEEQGLRPGDLIYRVDDFNLQGSDFGKVIAEHLWGPVGSPVTLHYRRPGLAGQHSVTLQRIPIEPQLTVTPAVETQK